MHSNMTPVVELPIISWGSIIISVVSMVDHWFGCVESWIFVFILPTAPACRKQQKVFKIRQVQINELPGPLVLTPRNSKNMIFEIRFYSHLILLETQIFLKYALILTAHTHIQPKSYKKIESTPEFLTGGVELLWGKCTVFQIWAPGTLTGGA